MPTVQKLALMGFSVFFMTLSGPAAIAQSEPMAKFSNDGGCSLHFIVRRGNTYSEFRFILDQGQVVHFALPNWSTYASQCDSWPTNNQFNSVRFEDE